ncbi:MAG: DUF2974 domain-containing protein [Clostridia bacterium]|nr:DUF2974 domain-containing protein [Clostridia bacterium]
MSNMIDYVKWRCDISFSNSPLNEVDSLIFTELSYLPFEHFVPSVDSNKKLLLSEVADRFFDVYDEDRSIGAIIPGPYIIKLFRLLSKSTRYAEVKMWAYVNDISKDKEKQFSAICFSWDKDNTYIAFRGTDDTLIGWKENLNMALYTPIPAQQDGVDYVEKIATLVKKDKLYIGGHSKGGNISVYSALNVSPKVKKRICRVYNFDGPGFTSRYLDLVNDLDTISKIWNYLPEGSLIGRIFDSVGEHVIVKSFVKGVQQHDAFSWDVMGAEFIRANKFESGSDDFHVLLKSWVSKMTEEDRHKFVDSFYRIATSTNASTLSDIMIAKMKFVMGVISSKGEDKKIVIDGIKRLLKEKNEIKGSAKSKLYLKKVEEDDTPIESVYFSPGNKKNK